MKNLEQNLEHENSKGITKRAFLLKAGLYVGSLGVALAVPTVSYAGGLLEKFGLSKDDGEKLDEVVTNLDIPMVDMLSKDENRIKIKHIEEALKNSKSDYGVLISEALVDPNSSYKRTVGLSVCFVTKNKEFFENGQDLFYRSFVMQKGALYGHANGAGAKDAVKLPPLMFDKKMDDFLIGKDYTVNGDTYANGDPLVVGQTQLMVAITTKEKGICNENSRLVDNSGIVCMTPPINCQYEMNKSTGKVDLIQIYR